MLKTVVLNGTLLNGGEDDVKCAHPPHHFTAKTVKCLSLKESLKITGSRIGSLFLSYSGLFWTQKHHKKSMSLRG